MWTHQKTKAGGKLITGMHLRSTPVWEEIIYLEVCICNPGDIMAREDKKNTLHSVRICENSNHVLRFLIGKVGVSPF